MYTIKDLREGKCAITSDGTLDELKEVLRLAFPSDKVKISGDCKYYFKNPDFDGQWLCSNNSIALPTQSAKDFLTEELKRGDLIWVSDRDPSERNDQRIYLAKIEGSTYPFVCVSNGEENSFKRGLSFSTVNFKYATKVEEPEEVEMSVAEIERALNIKNLKIVK